MSASQLIVLVTPVFLLLMALEWAADRRRGRRSIALADAIGSLNLGLLSQTSAAFTVVLRLGLYTLAWQHLALWRNDAFWTTWYGWLLALLLYDFCYYWLHRMGHEVAVLWAAHAVHHQSQHYNLSTALRQTSSGALFSWLFYLPMALAGVPPLVFVVVGLVDLLYQFWVHTEQVGRLGWFDRWFCSPSNHRVHHAVNDDYLDRNYGGILLLWDRLFGTFREEDPAQPCVYGTRGLLNSWDPLWANAQVYASLAQDSWRTRRWADKLRVWLKGPGWRPEDVARSHPKPAFDINDLPLFAPPMGTALRVFSIAQFMLLAAGAAVFLWHADNLPRPEAALWFATLLACQWALAAAVQGRIGMGLALMVEAGALATATSALGWIEWYWLFKPLAMAFAITSVAARLYPSRDGGIFHPNNGKAWLLLLALLASLAGDVALMLPGLFLPGLGAFLLAHLAYLRLFRQGVPWFAARRALVAVLAVGAAVYALLVLGGLPAALRLPVAAYVLVIALMAAQAFARHAQLAGEVPGTRAVAWGAALFLLSDALLAIDRFVQPLPAAQVGVLSSYYAAQALIVAGLLRALPRTSALARQHISAPHPLAEA
ncbi:lysoplasmalogenase family protein [Melaminivora sp.]|uniref:lysoplasmalogenase family protein n=1 Tax=Melaminivora sp. TaxID=1933032 RepID=UPI0028AEC979|nr:lysoplasmalogenase family protein [Melaminivora sp.]